MLVACRRCVGDRACGRGYGALGVHLRIPYRERRHEAPIRTAATADVNVARASLRESVPAITGTVRGRGLSVWRSNVRPRPPFRGQKDANQGDLTSGDSLPFDGVQTNLYLLPRFLLRSRDSPIHPAGQQMTSRVAVAPESVLLGASAVMRRVREQIVMLAGLDWHVRIEGPTGSGKTVAARLLHDLSRRAMAPFVVCSLAMLPDAAELAELVGHRRGAYTGAVEDRVGRVEEAHTGTLFLEELGTASPRTQDILLQIVEGGSFNRMGENRVRSVDVRFVTATNVKLEELVAQGRFRADLYHRLGLLGLRMPALAEHREDIPDIADHIMGRLCEKEGRPVPRVSSATADVLAQFAWPGNVRQLASVLQYFIAFERLPDMLLYAPRAEDWRERLDAVLHKHGGRRAPAAAELGVSRETVYKELRRRQG